MGAPGSVRRDGGRWPPKAFAATTTTNNNITTTTTTNDASDASGERLKTAEGEGR